ncbi:hypothetical protein ES708_16619 [subsurface metagenome]
MVKRSRVIAGTRKVVRLGGSLVFSLPAEFCHLHNIKEGDDLPFAANHIMKVIPMPEGKEDMEEEEVVGGKR